MAQPQENVTICVRCYRESGGGTRTPAVAVYQGDTICERHAELTLEEQTPVITPH